MSELSELRLPAEAVGDVAQWLTHPDIEGSFAGWWRSDLRAQAAESTRDAALSVGAWGVAGDESSTSVVAAGDVDDLAVSALEFIFTARAPPARAVTMDCAAYTVVRGTQFASRLHTGSFALRARYGAEGLHLEGRGACLNISGARHFGFAPDCEYTFMPLGENLLLRLTPILDEFMPATSHEYFAVRMAEGDWSLEEQADDEDEG